MKKIDITSQISGIDPKYLDEALTYRAPRVNKIRVLALAACFAALVTAIPLSLIMNREDQAEAPETTLSPGKESITNGNSDTVIVDPQPLKVIYCDASSVSPEYLETNFFKDKNIKVESFDYFHFNILWKEEYGTIAISEDVPEKLTLSLRNKEFTAYFDIAYCSSNTDNEVLNAYAKIARYKIEGTEKSYIYYCIGTKTIILTDDLPLEDTKVEPKYTEEEIANFAYQDIKSIYGEELFEKYSLKHCFSDGNGLVYWVQFIRMIGDYDTGSSIQMLYTGEGELISYGTDNFGMYDFAEHLLNEEKLLEIEKEAQELIQDNLVCEKKLMIHKDGYVCVRYLLYIGDDERGSPETVYLYFRLE